MDKTVLTREDIISIIKYLIELINSKADVDDIDHLSNRRVRTVGEQLYNQFAIGLARMTRTIKERMNVRDNETFTPVELVNPKTISSVINTFFGTNALSQFMDQTNPLAEITHKRRLSALGPGGLSRERAGFEVRDVHYTHYGRLCPIETPEGPNIGLISSLCVYAKINELGFIETPYRKVENGKVNLNNDEVVYMTAEIEEGNIIAQGNAELNDDGTFRNNKVKARLEADFPVVSPEEVQLMDVSPMQIASIAASLIPFLEHDDANRALMGSNMMRQAVPLMRSEAPIVGTGIEGQLVRDSRTQIVAEGRRRHHPHPLRPHRGGRLRLVRGPGQGVHHSQVPQDQPEHHHRPASHLQPRPARAQGRHPHRGLRHRKRRAGPGPQPQGGLHALEGLQL